MKSVVYYLPNGKITRRTVGAEVDALPEEMFLEYDGHADLRLCYVDGGQIQPMPPCPSEWHEFDYATKEWVLNVEAAWEAVRYKRNQRLAASDWTQLPDVPLTTKEAWAAYRQALRDITEQPDPLNIVWPEPPA